MLGGEEGHNVQVCQQQQKALFCAGFGYSLFRLSYGYKVGELLHIQFNVCVCVCVRQRERDHNYIHVCTHTHTLAIDTNKDIHY